MPLSATLSPPSLYYFPQTQHHQPQHHLLHALHPHLKPKTLTLQFQSPRASRRSPNYPQGGGADNLADDPRSWGRSINSEVDRRYDFEDDDEDDEDDDDDEEDRSLDLLVRFVQNVFKKVSRRARRAVRSVLPVSIPTKLVGFSVNGVLMLAFLWVLKAFLEVVVCTLGSLVFVSILLIRGIWTGVAYYQYNRNQKPRNFEDDNRPWAGAQPAT